MKKPLKIILILLLLVLVAGGLYLYLRPKAMIQIVFPDLEKMEKVKIRLEKDTAVISFNAVIQNKGIFKLNIDSLYYRVALDTSELLNRKQLLAIVLEPGKEDTVWLMVRLPFSKLQKQIKALQVQDSTKIYVDLKVLYKTRLGKATLPVKREFVIEVPHPPRFELVKTEYIGRDKKTLHINAHIKVENKGKLDLKITNLTYKMDIQDLFSIEEKYPEKVIIKPGTTEIIVLPVDVEIKKLFKTAMLILTDKDQVTYRLKMNAMVESDMVDAEKTPFELVKEGTLELKK